MGTEVDEFLADMLPKQVAAETAIHNGDVEPRLALWSRNDPVTVFGAKRSGTGWNELDPMFRTVASWFSDSTEYDFEVVNTDHGAYIRSQIELWGEVLGDFVEAIDSQHGPDKRSAPEASQRDGIVPGAAFGAT